MRVSLHFISNPSTDTFSAASTTLVSSLYALLTLNILPHHKVTAHKLTTPNAIRTPLLMHIPPQNLIPTSWLVIRFRLWECIQIHKIRKIRRIVRKISCDHLSIIIFHAILRLLWHNKSNRTFHCLVSFQSV